MATVFLYVTVMHKAAHCLLLISYQQKETSDHLEAGSRVTCTAEAGILLHWTADITLPVVPLSSPLFRAGTGLISHTGSSLNDLFLLYPVQFVIRLSAARVTVHGWDAVYKPEGSGFESCWGNWIFSIYQILPAAPWSWVIPPLWYSGQSSWLQIQGSRVRFPGTTRKKRSGSGTGSTQPRECNWGATWKKSSGSFRENREYGRRDPSRRPRGTCIRKSWQSLRRQAAVAR
jgi:hypothetical protein